MRKGHLIVLIVLIILMLFPCVVHGANAVPAEVLDVRENLVRIFSVYEDGKYGSGTGFAIGELSSPVEYIATNYHVVADNPILIDVWRSDTDRIQATIYKKSVTADLAILKLDTPIYDMPPVVLETETEPDTGDAIYALGFPAAADAFSKDYSVGPEDVTITDGIISAIKTGAAKENGPDINLIQINAAISPGNSGGPLVNESGHVIGINTFTVLGTSVNAAVNANELIPLLDSGGIAFTGSEDVVSEDAAGETAAAEEDAATEAENTAEESAAVEDAAVQTDAVPEDAAPTPVWPVIVIVVSVLIIAALVFLLLRKRNSTPGKGIPFQSYIDANNIPVDVKLSMIAPLFGQVAEMHSRGKFDLSICPEHITVHGNTASLKTLKQKSQDGINIQPGYSPIEKYSQDKIIGPWTDVYALSALLYAVFTGMRPPNSFSRDQKDISFPSDIPEKYTPLIDAAVKGLKVDPQQRYVTASELYTRLQASVAAPRPEPSVSPLQASPSNIISQQAEPQADPKGQYDRSPVAEPADQHVSARKKPNTRKKIFAIAGISVVALIIVICGLFLYVDTNYNQAVFYTDNGDYGRADNSLHQVIVVYKDSDILSRYVQAILLIEGEEYDKSIDILQDLNDYRDSNEKLIEASYLFAVQLLENGTYERAKTLLDDLGDYKETVLLLKQADFLKAQDLIEAGELDEAELIVTELISSGYEDAIELKQQIDSQRAKEAS